MGGVARRAKASAVFLLIVLVLMLGAGCAAPAASRQAMQPTQTPVAAKVAVMAPTATNRPAIPTASPTRVVRPTLRPLTPAPKRTRTTPWRERVVVPTSTRVPLRATALQNIGTILFIAPDKRAILRVRPDGSAAEVVVSVDESSAIDWYSISPDGNALLYTTSSLSNVDAPAQTFLYRDGRSSALPTPLLLYLQWSPDGRRLLGTIAHDQPDAGRLYIYDLMTTQGQVLPIGANATWCSDTSCLYIVQSRMVPRKWYQNTDSSTSDLFRYDLATGQQTRLTYLDEALVTLPRGDKGTSTWTIYSLRYLPATHEIAFQSVLEFDHVRYPSWYRIPTGGLPRGDAPRGLAGGNGGMLLNRAGTKVLSAGYFHNDACSNPNGIGVTDLQQPDPVRASVGVYFRLPDDAEVTIHGFDWSPNEQQIVFAASVYTCGGTAWDRTELQPFQVYIWDVAADRDAARLTLPLVVAVGTAPQWMDVGALALPPP